MNYLLNKSAIERILRQTDSEPEQLLEWFEWAVEEYLYQNPCIKKPYLNKYVLDEKDAEEVVIKANDISNDFNTFDFYMYCKGDRKYYKKVIKEYKERFNLWSSNAPTVSGCTMH